MHLSDLIKKMGKPQGFQEFPWNPTVMVERNVPSDVWDWSHLNEKGTYAGCILDSKEQEQDPFEDWGPLIGMVGQALLGMREVAELEGSRL